MALPACTRLGPYEILALIGAGGMGEVYKARDTRLDRTVALKVLPEALASDPERRARLQREARAISTLNHPHICVLYDIGADGGTDFLVMEYVDGQPLSSQVRPGGLPLSGFLPLAIQLAEAVGAAHQRGIVHRDLKPANVMVTEEKHVKVLDFGLAKLSHAPPGASGASTEFVTTERVLVGTVPYMSPEQVRGEPADHRSDIFSLGAVLYELAAGSRPFGGATAAELISSILRDTPRPVTELNPRMPARLNSILARCLEKDPQCRPRCAGDVRDDLDALWRDHGPASRPPVSSIAVLPFRDMSEARDQAYFCEGVAEEIVNALAQLEGLHVASRMSSFQLEAPVGDSHEIGRRLGVATLLEGSVRKAGDRLRITTQLIDVASGYHLWSERYDRRLEDIFDIQDEIARSVLRALRLTLPSAFVLQKGPAARVEAYDYYLRGRHYVAQRTGTSAEFAREMFSRAIEIDPEYGLAYAQLAHCHSLLHVLRGGRAEDLTQADAASRKALELAPGEPEAHAFRGLALSQARRFDEAESEYRAAMRLNPRQFDACYFLARDKAGQGNLEEAVTLFERASDACPEDYQALSLLAVLYRKLSRHAEAAEASRRALTIIERQLALNPDDVRARVLGANALQSLGERDRGLEWTARAVALDPEGLDTLYNAACAYSRASEADKALDLLDKVAGRMTTQSEREWLALDVDLAPLRDHPRFQRLFGNPDPP